MKNLSKVGFEVSKNAFVGALFNNNVEPMVLD